MKKLIQDIIWGKAATGIPLSCIKSSTHTCYPDYRVPQSSWHNVLYKQLQEVHKKLKEQ